MNRSSTKSLWYCTIAFLTVIVPITAQQTGDLFGRSLLLNDGGIAGSTKNTITLIPPNATTLTTDYSLILPSAVPTVGNFLRAGSVAGTVITLDWNAVSTATSPYEEATAFQRNIRRITSLVNGTQVTPGFLATDLQAGHTAAGQTATANYSIIAGGSENTNSGQNAGILSGNLNNVASNESAIGGGVSNTISSSGFRSFIGAGSSNTVSVNFSAVVGGQNNSVSGGINEFIGGGQGNSVTVNYSSIGGGQSNSITGGQFLFIGGGSSNSASINNAVVGGGANNAVTGGQYGAILGGFGNTVTGNSAAILGGSSNSVSGQFSAIIGGQNLTLSGAQSLGFSTGSAMTVSTSGVFVVGNANLWLANNSSTASELRFFESQASTGAFPAAGTNYVAFKAGSSMTNDNTYTLPTTIGSAGQVLRIASSPAPTATTAQLDWVTISTPTVVTQAIVADNTLVTVAATTSFLRLDGNGIPANRTVTLANGSSDGQLLVIRGVAFGANGIELQDAGNLRLSGDVQLNNNDTITLIWDATSVVWIEVARRNN
ncbi:MAG: hypothetical protein JSS89_06885 [Bacteroidetes bacterium]|nr:hypothetical protein [Bacteroidota bacterium]